jgi:hypothetical protein
MLAGRRTRIGDATRYSDCVDVAIVNGLFGVLGLVAVALITVYGNRKLNRIEENGNSKLSDAFDRIDLLQTRVEELGGSPTEGLVPSGSSGRTPAEDVDLIAVTDKNTANAITVETVKDAVRDENFP